MDVDAGKFYNCSGCIEVFVLDFAFCIAVECVGVICIEFFYIKMRWSHSNFFVWSECDGEWSMRNIFAVQSFNHGHDFGDSGFIICAENCGSVGSNQSSAF